MCIRYLPIAQKFVPSQRLNTRTWEGSQLPATFLSLQPMLFATQNMHWDETCPPQRSYSHRSSECGFIWKEGLCGYNSVKNQRWDQGLESALKDSVFIRDGKKKQQQQRLGKKKALWRQRQSFGAKGHLEPPGAGRGRKNSPLKPSAGAQPCPHLDFELLASRT